MKKNMAHDALDISRGTGGLFAQFQMGRKVKKKKKKEISSYGFRSPAGNGTFHDGNFMCVLPVHLSPCDRHSIGYVLVVTKSLRGLLLDAPLMDNWLIG